METKPVTASHYKGPRLAKPLLWIACMAAAGIASASRADVDTKVTVTPLEDRVRIEIGGKLFSEYRYRGWPKPCLYPVLDGDGLSYTRDWPMRNDTNDVVDHAWHRGVWFGLGMVNGLDFWREIPKRKTGSIVHDAILETRNGPEGLLRTRCRWLAADGTVVCVDETTMRFHRNAAGSFIDYDVTLKASNGPLIIGDTEEGVMAVRVNEAIRVIHGEGEDKKVGTGHIVTANGVRDIPAWGTKSPWCDYWGPLADGRVIGVAIFDHPGNPRHPTWWHVRPYGLLAANAFGQHDFENLKNEHAGDLSIPAGDTLTLRYRVYFHRGDEKTGSVAEQYREYAKQ